MSTPPPARSVPIPAPIYETYLAAAEIVAKASDILAAIPAPKLAQMLIEVELRRHEPSTLAKRFIRAATKPNRVDDDDLDGDEPVNAPPPPPLPSKPQPTATHA
jgi:hypothetical protein